MDERLSVDETPDGLQVHYKGRPLYGRLPRSSAVRRIAPEIAPGTLVLWLSPVVWHGVDELLARCGEASALLAVEADDVLYELSDRTRVTTKIPLVRATPHEVVAALRSIGERRVRRVVEVTTSGAALTNRARYRELVAILDREIRVFWQNRLTLAAFGRLWLRNLIRNLPRLADARALGVVDLPAVVCGAGPSLDASIPLIEEARSRLLLVTVDTALPVLAAHGVQPDLVVALEGQLANVYDFLGTPDRGYRLVADLASAPAAVRLHREVSWTLTRFAPFHVFDRLGTAVRHVVPIDPYGSVGVAAVAVALRATKGALYTAGLDFAVRRGVTHARGAPASRHALVTCTRLNPPRDATVGARLLRASGPKGPVLTTLVLSGYAEELSRLLGSSGRDAYAIEPSGLAHGASPVSVRAARDSLISGPSARSAKVDSCADDQPTPVRALGEIARREIDLLRRADLANADRLPPEIDYLAAEVPELIASFAGDDGAIVLLPPSRDTRARLQVVRDYYVSQWTATARRIDATLRRP